MHHLTDAEIMQLCIEVVVVSLVFLAGFLLGVWSTTKLPKQPVYMIKGMHKNFSKIEDKIKACENKEDLRDTYLSIFSFEALYPDSASFTSELYEKYTIKQQEIAKGIREPVVPFES